MLPYLYILFCLFEKIMGGGGFEPPKQIAADLQSVPFGHSGIHPSDDKSDTSDIF